MASIIEARNRGLGRAAWFATIFAGALALPVQASGDLNVSGLSGGVGTTTKPLSLSLAPVPVPLGETALKPIDVGLAPISTPLADISAKPATVPLAAISTPAISMPLKPGAVPLARVGVPALDFSVKAVTHRPTVGLVAPSIKLVVPQITTVSDVSRRSETRVVVERRSRATRNVFIRGSSTTVYNVIRQPQCLPPLQVELDPESVLSERAVRAVCVDDRGGVHPASRLDAALNVAADHDGELYRCVVGTSMMVTLGQVTEGRPDFGSAQTFQCAKGEALVHSGGELFCAPQSQQRQCFERSLLRRHGPGDKIVALAPPGDLTAGGICFDGGVGQIYP